VESGDITIKKTIDNSTVEAIDVTSGQVTGTGTTTITINPGSDLASETGYYVQIDATAFDDAASNSYIGISDTTTWSFTSQDLTNPSVSTLSPADDATGVAVGGNLVVTFDEAVDVESGNTHNQKNYRRFHCRNDRRHGRSGDRNRHNNNHNQPRLGFSE